MQTYDQNGQHLDDDERDVTGSAVNEMLPALMRAEIDGQIATARAFPRKIGDFAREARQLVTLDEETAQACIYALPRGKGRDAKTIAGPSARFAEIIQYCFGNNRGGGRVISDDGDYVTAQGTFHDLEKNVQVTMEVQRRIVDKYGKRYNADMIGVTGNAAAAIAHRNAVLKAIPKALWLPLYEAARFTAIGDIKTLSVRRDAALGWFAKSGVTLEMILAKLELAGVEDIGLDELEILTGLKTALRDGSSTVERMFAPPEADGSKAAELAEKIAAKRDGKPATGSTIVDPTVVRVVARDPDTNIVLPMELQNEGVTADDVRAAIQADAAKASAS
jgi:hypothetical protein